MPVVYGSSELMPTLSVIYVCRCGLQAGEYGQHAAEPPPNWVQVDPGEYLCAHCAARARETEAGRAGKPTP
jgi:hypothetical protein